MGHMQQTSRTKKVLSVFQSYAASSVIVNWLMLLLLLILLLLLLLISFSLTYMSLTLKEHLSFIRSSR